MSRTTATQQACIQISRYATTSRSAHEFLAHAIRSSRNFSRDGSLHSGLDRYIRPFIPLFRVLLADAEVRISREACLAQGLDLSEIVNQGVQISAQYLPQNDEHQPGFDLPLVNAGLILGLLTVDYPASSTIPPQDVSAVMQLALLISSLLAGFHPRAQSISNLDYFQYSITPTFRCRNRVDRDIRVANHAFCELFGLPLNQVIGRSFGSLLSVSEQNTIQPTILRGLAGHETRGVELSVENRAGSEARLALNVAPVRTANGSVEGIIAIAHDLTEVHQLEAQVAQAEKLATLGQLAAGVVHELNNPLTSIAVYSEYLLRRWGNSDLAPEDLEKLRRIGEGVGRIRRFTQDLVTYARPSNEPARHLSVDALVERSLIYCEHILMKSGAQVQLDIPEQTPSVIGVADQLHQVFINLITNACHAMPEGAGGLVISVSAAETGLAISVKDNGAGVPPDLQDRIFRPFFTTKDGGRGSGLGLSIVRKILHHHGGDITLRSELGQGTQFIVLLPTDS